MLLRGVHNMKIHCLDQDPRQITDPENYLENHGSMSEVCIQLNEALKKINCYADPDDADFVGTCEGLGVNFKYKNKPSFIIHVWENNSLPVFVFEGARNQRIFGLSNQITENWHKYGRTDVTTVYGGCNTNYWYPDHEKFKIFTFLHINSSNVRSGLDLSLQAFHLAFAGNPNVRMLVKDTNPQKKDSILLKRIKELKMNGSNIEYVSERWPSSLLRQLYSQSHVTLNLLRSTSFGMPLLDCSACGSLCVTGDIAPTNELVSKKSGVLIPAKEQVSLRTIVPYLENEWGLLNCFGNFRHIEDPFIADFDIEEYAKKMLDIYENYDKVDKYHSIDRKVNYIKSNWSWKSSAVQLVKALND